MKRRTILASIALTLGCLGGPIVGAQVAAWQEFTSREGRFSVLFPGKPLHQEANEPSPLGEIAGHLYGVTTSPNGGFFVGYHDFPMLPNVRIDRRRALTGARDGAIRNVQGTLETEKRLTLNGHPGREFAASAPMGVRVRARLYFVGNRMYSVIATGSREELNSPDVGKFLESFKLTR